MKDLTEELRDKVIRLQAERDAFYQDARRRWIPTLDSRFQALAANYEIAVETLRWYANGDHYDADGCPNDDVDDDSYPGKLARSILKELGVEP